ncbi:unnamed protein product [Phytophthora lilii]|uniref:Unnamed protein product n=1 Tax=Phytophthora lilii TaxID=2077276 RepID=A0A9W6X8H1_9STRA|nr:unnamed protein product [Phytophthora lilii]
MLKSVEVVLRQNELVNALECNVHLIASFLGPSRNLSLSAACAFGSIALLDWIWECSCTSIYDRTSQWSLANFLRSEPHYYRWQFAASLKVAAQRGDLAIVRWLFEHFSECEAPSSVVREAANNGHLSVLQFLYPFRKPFPSENAEDLGQRFSGLSLQNSENNNNSVYWDDAVLLTAAESGHGDVVRWLYEMEGSDLDPEHRVKLVENALRMGDFDLADTFLPMDGSTCVLDYDNLYPSPELIERMLDLGYLHWDQDLAGCAIRDLASSGHLELMQQIFLLHSPLQAYDEEDYWLEYWGDALKKACKSGELRVLEWLVSHPIGGKRCYRFDTTRYIDYLLYIAAKHGRIDVIRFLCERGAADTRGYALTRAADESRMDCAKWLLEHLLYTADYDLRYVLHQFIRHGQVELFQLLQKLSGVTSSAPRLGKRKRMPRLHLWNSFQCPIECGALNWCKENRLLDRSPTMMERAARGGHLAALKWLNTFGSKACSAKAMDDAASAGHLDVVEWLHVNRSEGCTTDAMDSAAARGHLKILQFLHAYRSEGCTKKAIKRAVDNGHLHVACWLQEHVPEHSLELTALMAYSPVFFEILLFVHVHYPHLLSEVTVHAVELAIPQQYRNRPGCHVVDWFREVTGAC